MVALIVLRGMPPKPRLLIAPFDRPANRPLTDFYTSDGGSTPPSPTSVSDKTPSPPLSALNSCTKLHLRRGALPPRRVAGVVGTWAGHRSVFSEPARSSARSLGMSPTQAEDRNYAFGVSGVGTLTLLFTDLVGSTQSLIELGEDRFDAVRDEHDALVGGSIAAHHGELVKHTGDGYM